ncbi:MAG: hypothetical protein MUF84_17195, partial [Anaerolineae bacterium]|nr:hypothetical protein [Anaerolineae bacterium]
MIERDVGDGLAPNPATVAAQRCDPAQGVDLWSAPENVPRLWAHVHLVLLTFALGLASVALVACRPGSVLGNVSLNPNVITPNADGDTDLTRLEFRLLRNASVGFQLVDVTGETFVFRPPRSLGASEVPYAVYFGGVVEGYQRPDDPDLDYAVLKRMLPDGDYTWVLTADAGLDRVETATGTLTIVGADTTLPGIRGFTASPDTFSPNQDGISDRVTINLVLEKDVAELRVYLKGQDGLEHPIPEDERLYEPNAAGWHTYDYDGGIDAGSEPPPDGVYGLYAEALDAMGQHTMVTSSLELVNAGLPRAYIVNGEVEYSATTLVLSDTLCFTLTVENDSDTHIRTTGPWPGTTYRSDQNFNSVGWSEESGVFR